MPDCVVRAGDCAAVIAPLAAIIAPVIVATAAIIAPITVRSRHQAEAGTFSMGVSSLKRDFQGKLHGTIAYYDSIFTGRKYLVGTQAWQRVICSVKRVPFWYL
jgi:hypothetical protein